jgi:hypothetical protein
MSHRERAERRRRIADAVAEGVPADVICNREGVSLWYIDKACQEAGISRPPLSSDSGVKRRVYTRSHASFRILAELQNTTATMGAIATKFKVHRQAVRQVLDAAIAAGIKLPPCRALVAIKGSE